MNNKGISLALLLITVLAVSSASCVIATEYHYADSSHVPTPSAPQFTIKFADYSHNVAPTTTTTTNPYNGNTTTTTTPGYHVKDYRIEMTIQNKIYPTTIDGDTYQLYYSIQTKGHFEQWTSAQFNVDDLKTPSTSEYTTLSWNANYQPGDQIDYRIQAVIGSFKQKWNTDHMFPIPAGSIFNYRSSGWSPTQTFKMPDTNTHTQNPTTTPTEPVAQTGILGLNWKQTTIALIVIVITALAAGFTLYNKRIKSKK